jgi:hypothetical protein
MLIFYSNFIPECPDILFDCEQNKGYTLIQKCGTQSLLELLRRKPERFSIQKLNGLTDLTVFIRDPMERFISGLATQINIYKLDINTISRQINEDKLIPTFDIHTLPQFYFLLRLGLDKNIKFTFKSISSLAEVDPSILNLNQNYNHNYFEITEEAKLKIMHFLTEDIVMYNQFLNKTTTLDVIINAIKQEKDFIKDMTQYKKAINYLF